MNTMIPVASADVRKAFAEKVERRMFAPVARHLREDPLMLSLREAGHTLGGIAAAMGRSTSAAFSLRRLGRELAERAGVEMESRA